MINFVNINKGDTQLRYKWLSDKEINKYTWETIHQKITTLENYIWFTNYYKIRDKKFFMIKYDNIKIGYVGLSKINKIDKNAEISIVIWEKQYRWKWIWKLAMKKIIDYGFNKLWLHKLYLTVFEENTCAVWLYKSLWFQIEWTFIDCSFYENNYYNAHSMYLLNPNESKITQDENQK